MPHLVIRQTVEDFATWHPRFTAQAQVRRAHGARGGSVFRGVANPDEVLIVLEWDDLDRADIFAQSDELREELAGAGGAGQPVLWLLAESDRRLNG